MIPERVQRIALAALLHDLPGLVQRADRVPAGARRVLELAELADPADLALVRQAEGYVLGPGADQALVAGGPLRSIFSRVALRAGEPPLAWHGLAPLAAATDLHDGQAPAAALAERPSGAYLATMLKALDRLAALADLGSFDVAYTHLLAWIDRYGRCLPAHQDDVALCDHARLTAAVAVCLAQTPEAPDEPFGLVAGTLVGVRGYCLAAGLPPGDLTRLQARSLYVAALREALGHELAERLGLPLANLLSQAGGRFVLLVANTPATAATLATIGPELDAWLHQHSAGALAFALARVPLGAGQLQPSDAGQPGFGAALDGLHAALDRAGRQPARAALIDAGGWREDAFVLREHSYAGHAPCAGCGRAPGTQAGGACPDCARDERLGQVVAQARYLAYYRGDSAEATLLMPGRAFRALAQIGPRDLGQPYLVIKLNDPNIDELSGVPGAFRYAASRLPLDDDGAALRPAAMARQAHGQALLGYLQVAIDGADVLPQGLRRAAGGYDSAAHVIGLLREIDLLGTGWLQRMLGQLRYASFAALDLGEELLLAGPWNQAAHLAIELRAQLGRCTGHNPAVTCSAGLLLAKAHYPLARAAADVRAALGQAQARPAAGLRDVFGDRLTLLGDSLRWTDTPQIFAEIARLHQHGQSLGAPLLRDLIEYARLQRLWSEEQRVEGLRYKALFAYNIARALRRGDAEIYRWADELMQSLHGQRESLAMRHLGLIATYLLLLRRDE